jgi:dTDP-4-dehydrorhamnose reductase
MRVLVLGAGGMLGSAFVRALAGHDVTLAGREALDVRRPGAVTALVDEARPEVAINCAAHTDVDGAERDPDPAFAANAMLPGLLAQACRRAGAALVHVSSTGCYGVAKTRAVHRGGRAGSHDRPSSLQGGGGGDGRESGCEHLILRTGWLFGGAPGHAKNFVWKRLLEARGAERMTSDASQRGNPTFVDDVVRQVMALIEVGLRGTYNVVSPPGASRAEYVAGIVTASGCPAEWSPRRRRSSARRACHPTRRR